MDAATERPARGVSRTVTAARFDETIPEPSPTKLRCDYECGEPIYVGDTVILTYEGAAVHEDCWRDYCDETYRDRRGIADLDGNIT